MRVTQDDHDVSENIFSSVFHLIMRSFLLSPIVRSPTFHAFSIKKTSVLFMTKPLGLFVFPVTQSDIWQRYKTLKKSLFIIWFMLLFHNTWNTYLAKVSHFQEWTHAWHIIHTSDANFNHFKQIYLLFCTDTLVMQSHWWPVKSHQATSFA